MEKIDESFKLAPATVKQQKLIEKLLRDFPDSATMLEYEDYQREKTVGVASEFITRAIEDNAHEILNQRTYADYIGTRPGAERFGSHIRSAILSSDMIVFATPLYYYGMSAQLKIAVDRFCAYNSSITRKKMKSALLAVAWNSDNWTFDSLESHYRTLVRYLHFDDQGMVLGRGCGSPGMTRNTEYPEKAYELGRSL